MVCVYTIIRHNIYVKWVDKCRLIQVYIKNVSLVEKSEEIF